MRMIIVVTLLSILWGCKESKIMNNQVKLEMINLAKQFTDRHLEFSGLDWYGDSLFFLTQIPSKYDNHIFFSTRQEIHDALHKSDSLYLHPINFKQEGVADKIGKIPDYEAIAFKGDSVYLLIEAENPMSSFIVQGMIDNDGITIQKETVKQIPLKNDLSEIACEALIIKQDKIYVFYEANGANILNNPQVFCFDLSLNSQPPVSFENLEYRITDATQLLNDNSFWIINHLWSGEIKLLNPAEEKLIPSTYNSNKDGINRLIKLQFDGDRVKISNRHPLMLENGLWNWEGLAVLDSMSFLIVNDEFCPEPYRTGLGIITLDSK